MLLTCSCEMFTTEEGIYQEVASCLQNIKSLQKWLVKIALTFIIFFFFFWLVVHFTPLHLQPFLCEIQENVKY